MATAVSRLSPVIITVCIPARVISRTAAAAVLRTGSLMPMSATSAASENGGAALPPKVTMRAMTRMAFSVMSFNCVSTVCFAVKGRSCPSASTNRVQAGSSFSGAPFTSTRPSASAAAAYFFSLSNGVRFTAAAEPVSGRTYCKSALSVALPPTGAPSAVTLSLFVAHESSIHCQNPRAPRRLSRRSCRFPSPVTAQKTDGLPCVSVPVLSVNSKLRLPAVSMPKRRRTSTWSRSIRRMLADSTTVIIMGSPSGTATTTTVMASVAACSSEAMSVSGFVMSGRMLCRLPPVSIQKVCKRSASPTSPAAT